MSVFGIFGSDERKERAAACEGCEAACTLDQAKRGDCMVVTGVDDAHARIHAIRFGMAEGAKVTCVTRIPAGPIVLRSGRQEIAVGRELAKRISVRHVSKHGGPEVPATENDTSETE